MPATEAQLASIARVCAAVSRFEGWTEESIGQRIVGHDGEVIWTPDTTPDRLRWGKLGRKVDPTGVRPGGRPIIDVEALRLRLR